MAENGAGTPERGASRQEPRLRHGSHARPDVYPQTRQPYSQTGQRPYSQSAPYAQTGQRSSSQSASYSQGSAYSFQNQPQARSYAAPGSYQRTRPRVVAPSYPPSDARRRTDTQSPALSDTRRRMDAQSPAFSDARRAAPPENAPVSETYGETETPAHFPKPEGHFQDALLPEEENRRSLYRVAGFLTLPCAAAYAGSFLLLNAPLNILTARFPFLLGDFLRIVLPSLGGVLGCGVLWPLFPKERRMMAAVHWRLLTFLLFGFLALQALLWGEQEAQILILHFFIRYLFLPVLIGGAVSLLLCYRHWRRGGRMAE